ncbi:MAG: hypothetical protein KKD73_02745 [Proteobacteria bacterium]|nr:hypothetical protein [Pseudomonadota bacterium]MBU1640511.1 hypothetical protein [Pseudomonadota bacterium]
MINDFDSAHAGALRLHGGMAWLLPALLFITAPDLIHAANLSFEARMKTTIAEHSSMAEIVANGSLLRMKIIGGRTFSTMIADYNSNRLWLMAPGVKQYREMNVTAMGGSVPHFFRPDVIITKKRVAEEVVAGRMAIKYEAQIKVPGVERPYDGELWEAVDLPGYPLKWVDPEYRITVEWLDAHLTPRRDADFALPKDYSLIAEPAVKTRPDPTKP